MSTENKYAIFAPNMVGGGAERAAVQLANGLAARGCQVDLVLASAEGPRLDEVNDDVGLVDLKARRVLSSLPALIGYLRRERPAAMVSVLNHANIIALWARRLAGHPKRLIVVEQNNLSSAARHGKSRRDRMMPKIVKRFYPWADLVVGVSQGVVDDLKTHVTSIPDARYRVIFNPIVTDDITTRQQAQPDHHWFDEQVPVFVAAGRLRPQKDFPTLLDALSRVTRQVPARLIILGDGPDRAELQAQIDALHLHGSADLHGFTDNPYSYFARAAAFVLSSRWEGLPTVLVEALSCGAPVVATDCPNGPREILADGAYGRLIPVGDVGAMEQALLAVLAGDVTDPPDESWEPYTLDAVVDDYLEALDASV